MNTLTLLNEVDEVNKKIRKEYSEIIKNRCEQKISEDEKSYMLQKNILNQGKMIDHVVKTWFKVLGLDELEIKTEASYFFSNEIKIYVEGKLFLEIDNFRTYIHKEKLLSELIKSQSNLEQNFEVNFSNDEIRELLKLRNFTFIIDRNRSLNVNLANCSQWNVEHGSDTFRFSVSAQKFNKPKNDWDQCGQCQTELFTDLHELNELITNIDQFHLKEFQNLSNDELNKILNFVTYLMNNYSFAFVEGVGKDVKFDNIKYLSMKQPYIKKK